MAWLGLKPGAKRKKPQKSLVREFYHTGGCVKIGAASLFCIYLNPIGIAKDGF